MVSPTREVGSVDGGWKLTVLLIVVYLWWLVTTPEYSNRLEFLATIRFERILAVAILFAIILGGKVRSRQTIMTPLVLVFFVWANISYFVSPYSDFPNSEYWFGNYWKLITLYFFVLFSIEDEEDLRRVFLGFAFISLSYQLYSWIGFVSGGSYVWQQGIKRIVGAWSGGGAGAPNAFGLLGIYSIPFGAFLFKIERRSVFRLMAITLMLLSVASIMFSGTRGAFICLIILIAIYYRQRLLHPRRLIIAAVAIVIALMILPDDMKRRYFDLIFYDESSVQSRWDESAIESAEGRTQGIVDGWKLFLRRPVAGYGPEASSIARLEVRDVRSDRGEIIYVQLHNLYAQLLSELGIIGALLFLSMIVLYLNQLRELRSVIAKDRQSQLIRAEAELLIYLLLVFLLYGMVSHTLYKYYWFFLFGCQATLVFVARQMQANIDRVTCDDNREVHPNG